MAKASMNQLMTFFLKHEDAAHLLLMAKTHVAIVNELEMIQRDEEAYRKYEELEIKRREVETEFKEQKQNYNAYCKGYDAEMQEIHGLARVNEEKYRGMPELEDQ